MAPVFGTVAELQGGKSSFGLKLRLIRMYEAPEFRDKNKVFSMECIFHDKEGKRIHATIQRALISKFKPILKVGDVYAVMEFVVGMNTMRYKTTNSRFKILIFRQTKICTVDDNSFPKVMFNFKSYTDIQAIENVAGGCMFDVIGILVSRYKPQEIDMNGVNTRVVDIVLEDEKKQTIYCTLWESYADEIIQYLDVDHAGPIGVIIQFCRPTSYRGQIRVTNSYCATTIIFDDSINEIQYFTEKFLESHNDDNLEVSNYMPKTLHYINDEDHDIPIKTISEVQAEGKVGTFWVFAEIYGVDTIGAWAYLACSVCFSKLKEDSKKYSCEKCGSKDVIGRQRYQLTLGVTDEDGIAKFHLWDRECLRLIGKSACDLNSHGDLDKLPQEIQCLDGKKIFFKIVVKSGQTGTIEKGEEHAFKGAYSVQKVNHQTDEIINFCHHYSEYQGVKIEFDTIKLEVVKVDYPREALDDSGENDAHELETEKELTSPVPKTKSRKLM